MGMKGKAGEIVGIAVACIVLGSFMMIGVLAVIGGRTLPGVVMVALGGGAIMILLTVAGRVRKRDAHRSSLD